ncbi:MAG: hypothetical protein L0H97_05885 [Lactococcus sp.]|nr:hypothetical protein [Lactococcus sp.]
MEDLKIYIEVIVSSKGKSIYRVIREYKNWLGNSVYDALAQYSKNPIGRFRAKRKLNKWKKFHKKHDFTEDSHSIIEEVIE